jgi:hypothetical protein
MTPGQSSGIHRPALQPQAGVAQPVNKVEMGRGEGGGGGGRWEV